MTRRVTLSSIPPCLSLRLSQLSSFFLVRVLALVPFPLRLRSTPFLPLPSPVKNLYTFLVRSKSSEESAERFVLSLFDENRRFSVSQTVPLPLSFRHPFPLPRAYFLRRTFVDVFPLSSRKKFFYNFRIVLFRPSSFFQPRAGRSP